MSTRRDFLKHLVVGAAGLLVADDIVEAIVEPRQKFWVVGDITESTFPRWKPIRKASATYNHAELEQYIREMQLRIAAYPRPIVNTKGQLVGWA